jgi:hypothetical protein
LWQRNLVFEAFCYAWRDFHEGAGSVAQKTLLGHQALDVFDFRQDAEVVETGIARKARAARSRSTPDAGGSPHSSRVA